MLFKKKIISCNNTEVSNDYILIIETIG